MAYTATLKKLSEKLKTTYENTIFSHSGNVGDTREKELIDYLTKVMAHKYGFQSGEIFDIDDANSGQVDVIMYDNLFSTVFTDGSGKIIAPVESTYGVVSVKSKMGTGELDNAILGIQRYDNLKRPPSDENAIQLTPDYSIVFGNGLTKSKSIPQQNINCIFAFDTTVAIETIIQKVQAAKCVDLVVVPGKFCVLGRRRGEFQLSNTDGSPFEYSSINNENAVGIFILFLQLYLSRTRLVAREIESLVISLLRESTITTIVNK